MYRPELVVRTKLSPPRPRPRTLYRPRVVAALAAAQDYRVTVVHAGTGYGKSTALADLGRHLLGPPDAPTPHQAALFWYDVGEGDHDPLTFLLHLIHAFRGPRPELSDAPLVILEEAGAREGRAAWLAAVHALINGLADVLAEPAFLVLDDFHLVSQAPDIAAIVDRFAAHIPPNLHLILSARRRPNLPNFLTWQVKDELLEIGHEVLAFTPDEIASLFRECYESPLSPAEVEALAAETEGWAIALQLIWQGLRSGAVASVTEALPDSAARTAERLPRSLEQLFAYLAQEVLGRQPTEIRDFLLTTSALRRMSAPACDALREAEDSADLLARLFDLDLFVVDLGRGQSRYHHLFHDFLRQQAQVAPARLGELHQRAAAYYAQAGEREEAIYHLIQARSHEDAADLIGRVGEEMVRAGRLEALAGYLNVLPPDVLEGHPDLLAHLGDIARLRSRFEEALGWYQQAEQRWRARGDAGGISRALRGQARVYLDTVRPSQAEHLLQEALRLSDGTEDRESRARLLELLAENKLNLGRPEEAEALHAQARELREEGPGEAELAVRVMLRTGQLDQARTILERQAEVERDQPVRRPRAHRETLLLLSLIHAFQGDAEAAYRCAIEGTERGRELSSPFVIAVGYMRQGHAWLLRPVEDAPQRAIECFQQAIALGESLSVRRTGVEAQWGLCRAHGFHGDLPSAERAAAEGIETARQAGDAWIMALIELTLGAGHVLAGRYAAAVERLSRVVVAFQECNDTFGRAAARLWLGLAYQQLGERERMAQSADDLLALTEAHGYDYLFTRRTLLGPPDTRVLVPLLLEARRRGRHRATVNRLLAQMGLPEVELHPGYQLRLQTLGPFRAWRGAVEIAPREWRREKARQLFQLLLTCRGRMLQREEIVERLWPELEPEAAARDFKVALNALNRALEPDRSPGAESAYVLRHGSSYGLRPGADVWLDVEEFERLVAEGDRCAQADDPRCVEAYRQSLALYHGDYLQDSLYEDWASEERERLLALYLRTAEKLALVLSSQGQYDEAIAVCRRILAQDSCWERAYRLMMAAYTCQGNRPRALRVYQACVEALREELEAAPSPATVALYQRIISDEPLDQTVL